MTACIVYVAQDSPSSFDFLGIPVPLLVSHSLSKHELGSCHNVFFFLWTRPSPHLNEKSWNTEAPLAFGGGTPFFLVHHSSLQLPEVAKGCFLRLIARNTLNHLLSRLDIGLSCSLLYSLSVVLPSFSMCPYADLIPAFVLFLDHAQALAWPAADPPFPPFYLC